MLPQQALGPAGIVCNRCPASQAPPYKPRLPHLQAGRRWPRAGRPQQTALPAGASRRHSPEGQGSAPRACTAQGGGARIHELWAELWLPALALDESHRKSHSLHCTIQVAQRVANKQDCLCTEAAAAPQEACQQGLHGSSTAAGVRVTCHGMQLQQLKRHVKGAARGAAAAGRCFLLLLSIQRQGRRRGACLHGRRIGCQCFRHCWQGQAMDGARERQAQWGGGLRASGGNAQNSWKEGRCDYLWRWAGSRTRGAHPAPGANPAAAGAALGERQ